MSEDCHDVEAGAQGGVPDPLPCPWCGSKPRVYLSVGGSAWVQCTDWTCQSRGPTREFMAYAVSAWDGVVKKC